jgi:hypothetical protein
LSGDDDAQADDDQELLAGWLLDWEESAEQGQPIAPEVLAASRPDLLDDLRRRIASLEAFGRRVDRLTAGDSNGPETTAPLDGDTAASCRIELTDLVVHARGGIGEVLAAVDRDLGRRVALKRLRPESAWDVETRQRFLREAQLAGRLEHPGIVPVHALGADARGRPCYVTRFIDGVSFEQARGALHNPDPRAAQALLTRIRGEASDLATLARDLLRNEILRRFAAVCETMSYVHSRGLIHRDLKPANLMLGRYGETLVVDWGLARGYRWPAADEQDTAEPGVWPIWADALVSVGVRGTPAFMSPEQAAGRVETLGPATDIYSLGATLYALVTGQLPFTGPIHQVVQRIEAGDCPRPRELDPAIPRALEAIIQKAMALRPEARYATAAALGNDLENWRTGERVTAWREPWVVSLGRWIRKHRTAAAAVSAALLVGLIALGIAWNQRQLQTARQRARDEARVRSIATTSLSELPRLLRDLGPLPSWAVGLLRQQWAAGRLAPGERVGLAVALAPGDPGAVAAVADALLQADPGDFAVLRDVLERHGGATVVERFWTLVEAEPVEPEPWLRAASALAGLDPHNPRWGDLGPRVVAVLGTREATDGRWLEALAPVRGSLVEPLIAIHRYRRFDTQREPRVLARATDLLAALVNAPRDLAAILPDADPPLFDALAKRLAAEGDAAPRWVLDGLEAPPGPFAVSLTPSQQADLEGSRWARAAIALERWGRPELLSDVLTLRPDPTARSYLLRDHARLGGSRDRILQQLATENDTGRRRALVVLAGEHAAHWTAAEREALVQRLATWYRDDPDAGLHAALDWTLRRLGQQARLEVIDRELALLGRRPGFGWFLTSAGDAFAIVGGDALWPRRFAIGMREVTRAQYRAFAQARPDAAAAPPEEELDQYVPDDRGPIAVVNWFQAARYARWRTEQERSAWPAEPWCYPELALIRPGLALDEESGTRPGYRLPTEAEWAHAARAGVATTRPYGESDELLPRYAWYADTAGSQAHAAGTTLPNEWGLLDVLGNVAEWCQDGVTGVDPGTPGRLKVDPFARLPADPLAMGLRIVRGGAFGYPATGLTLEGQDAYNPLLENAAFGIRLVRSLPDDAR